MTGGGICSVAICKSNAKKAKQAGGENFSFHRFPKDPQIRKEWVRKCYRKDKFDPENKRVCSKHFSPDDYEDAMYAKLMRIQPKKLKCTAIPSRHLLPPTGQPKLSTRVERTEKKKKKALVEMLTQETSNVAANSEIEHLPTEIVEENIPTDISGIPSSSIHSENDLLKIKLESLQKENETLKRQILIHQNNEGVLKEKISEFDSLLKEAKHNFEEKVKESFKDFLSPNQVEIALKKKRRARWTAEEISKAFTLRYFSKRSYVYLRQVLHYPLPGLSTLQGWAANINLRNGILKDVLRIMDTAGKSKNQLQKTTVLCFDEVKVASLYEYDQKQDEVVGLYSYMQVVMSRGLFDKWKQPVYLAFDQKITKELLENIINELHKINYNVVACTSDCGGGNQGLWKEININVDKTFFPHPDTRKPIFFADIPHLLKLLRNWFLDNGFILNNGSLINRGLVDALVNNTNTEISSCHKLNSLHLNCDKTQRQNVRLAAELFSNTTATALKHYLPGNDKVLAKNVGDFFQLINNCFDIMNSYTPSASIPTKKPYGLDIEYQNETLEKMKSVISGMLCVGKKTLQIFQKGLLMSIKSLQSLYAHLKEEFNISYILTHRLNQDCLENFFSQLRTRGGLYDHPSPLQALYRIRMILLGKNPGVVQSHSNVEIPLELKEEYLLASAFKQAKIENINVEDFKQTQEEILDYDSSTSSSSTSSNLSVRNLTEKDGLAYIAGYLAKKHLKEYPHLGKHTNQSEESMNFHTYAMPSWIQSLSFGGLIQPSVEWSSQVEVMEKYFKKLHKDNFIRGPQIIKKTTKYMEKKIKINIPLQLIKAFCKQRIFVRIKYLNMQRHEVNQRKRKSVGSSRKLIKKMKKIVN